MRASCNRSYQIMTYPPTAPSGSRFVFARTRLRQAAGDASIGQRQVLGTVIGSLSKAPPDESEFRSFLVRRVSGLRACKEEFSRLEDQSSTTCGTKSSGHPCTNHRPLLVADLPGGPVCYPVSLFQLLGALPILRFGQHRFVPQFDRPLERNADLLIGGPHALQIRMTPRCLGTVLAVEDEDLMAFAACAFVCTETRLSMRIRRSGHRHSKNSMLHFALLCRQLPSSFVPPRILAIP